MIYSSSKVATCVGALRLVERGLLSLEDKVSKFLPEYASLCVKEEDTVRSAKKELLVKHLFTMCGGFTYNLKSEHLVPLKEDANATTRDVIRALAKEPLIFEPGTHFEYSLCHDILGAIIEVVSQKTLGEYLHDEIFAPLGMQSTTFHPSEEQKKRLSIHYVYNAKTGSLEEGDNLFTDYHLCSGYEGGGFGIYTTAEDYSKLADAIACGGTSYNGYEVLKPETVESFSRNWLDETQLRDFHDKMGHYGHGYGLGVSVLMDRKPRNFKCAEGVFGWGGAAGTKVYMDVKNKISIYYAQEVMGGPGGYTYEEHPHNKLLNMVYEILEGEWE